VVECVGGGGGAENSLDEMDGRSGDYVMSSRKIITPERLVEDYGSIESNALCFHDLLYYRP
jgi:hypothetical protein